MTLKEWKWKYLFLSCVQLTLCDPVICSPPGPSVHGILQAGILKWVAIPFSRVSSWPRFNPWVRKIPWRRKWKSTPVFLPGKSHGWRSLVDYSLWGHKQLDMTEWPHLTFSVRSKRQRCSLSLCLFNSVVEVLASIIRQKNKIQR